MPDDDDQDQQQGQEPEHIRDLRAKAREADELRKKVDQMERDQAFTKALGSQADHPAVRYFVKAYDGEMTVDAIKAAASEAGFLRTEQEASQPQQQDLAGHQRLTEASEGAGQPGAERLEDAIANAKSPEDVLTVMEKAGFPTSRNAY